MAKKKSVEGKNFAVIGKLKHYEGIADIKDRIEEDGGKCSSKITMKKDFVICNDPEKYADKLKDAYEFEIPIISELSFIKTFDRLAKVQEKLNDFVCEKIIITNFGGSVMLNFLG